MIYIVYRLKPIKIRGSERSSTLLPIFVCSQRHKFVGHVIRGGFRFSGVFSHKAPGVRSHFLRHETGFGIDARPAESSLQRLSLLSNRGCWQSATRHIGRPASASAICACCGSRKADRSISFCIIPASVIVACFIDSSGRRKFSQTHDNRTVILHSVRNGTGMMQLPVMILALSALTQFFIRPETYNTMLD